MSEMITFDTETNLIPKPKSKEKVYNIFPLVAEENSILKTKCDVFDFDSGVEFENNILDAEELSGRLVQTLKTHRAYGLAAPQCGINAQVFTFGYDKVYITMFNPKIVYQNPETVHMEEGCLSFPFLTLSISRSKSIRVVFQDENQKEHDIAFDGITARVILHEYQHLQGITFNRIAKPLALKQGLKKREKQIKRFARELVNNRVNV